MRKFGKKYVEASKNVDKSKAYPIKDAVKLAKETSVTKFDGTVDFAMKLNVDPKKADQQLRGSLVLPNGTGKTKRVLVIAKGAQAEAAKEYIQNLHKNSSLEECPSCHEKTLIHQGGCISCPSCGWSRCS